MAMSVVIKRAGLRRSQQGVTLIEALVTFIVLSIGLLGIVSLQALSKSAQHQAIQRSLAVNLANDLLERIHVNPSGVAFYEVSAKKPLGGGTLGASPTTDCRATTCSPAELAQYDLWRWERMLDGAETTITKDGVINNTVGLIAPRGCITFTADADFNPNSSSARAGTVSVIIQWRGLSESTDALTAGELSCGGASAGEDAFRRQVLVTSYVIDEDEA